MGGWRWSGDCSIKDGWHHLRGVRGVVTVGQGAPKSGANHGEVPWVGANFESSRRWDYVDGGDGFKGRCVVEMKGIFGGKSGANKGVVMVVLAPLLGVFWRW